MPRPVGRGEVERSHIMESTIYTYLIKSKLDNSYYTGISSNPSKRLTEHNSGKLATTAKKRPYKLVYVKNHEDYAQARKHEKWLKKKNREYKESLEKAEVAQW